MNIILVSSRLPTAQGRSRSVAATSSAVAFLLVSYGTRLAALLNYAALRYAAETHNPIVFSLFSGAVQEEASAPRLTCATISNAMATRLGEMQAQILRLDTLGDRVARLAGFKPQEFLLEQPPGRGGALSAAAVGSAVVHRARAAPRLPRRAQVDDRSDKLGLLDSLLTQDSARKQLLPSVLPIRARRLQRPISAGALDPFNGTQSFHEGVDFIADAGTPIVAAAAGVVVASEFHPQYGNMIEIDHGGGLVTRYAHCSRRLAPASAMWCMKGATIGEVGSTGRATGPHLHFEVRHHGVPQNPARFLRLSG